jgi:hypothetical protein
MSGISFLGIEPRGTSTILLNRTILETLCP